MHEHNKSQPTRLSSQWRCSNSTIIGIVLIVLMWKSFLADNSMCRLLRLA